MINISKLLIITSVLHSGQLTFCLNERHFAQWSMTSFNNRIQYKITSQPDFKLIVREKVKHLR